MTGNVQLTVPLVAAPAWAATGRAESARAHRRGERRRTCAARSRSRRRAPTSRSWRSIAWSRRRRRRATPPRRTTTTRTRASRAASAAPSTRCARSRTWPPSRPSCRRTSSRLARAREALGVLVGTEGPVDAVDEVDPAGAAVDGRGGREARARDRTDVRLLDMRVASAKRAAGDTWAYYMPYLAAVGTAVRPAAADARCSRTFGWQAQLRAHAAALRRRPAQRHHARARRGARRGPDQPRGGAAPGAGRGPRQLRGDAARRPGAGVGARRRAPGARAAMDLATIAYRAGATTNLEVIDAARSARDADTAAAQAEDLVAPGAAGPAGRERPVSLDAARALRRSAARRRSRCRRGRSSRLRRPRPRDRRSCPSTARAGRRWRAACAASRSRSARSAAKCGRASPRGGISISPSQRTCVIAAKRSSSAGRSAGRDAASCCASPATLTWTRHACGAPRASTRVEQRAANRSSAAARPCPATYFTLLLCSGPMKCHSGGAGSVGSSASRALLSRSSWA